ncbi:MAG: carboxypeptidase-like regulatory domain-containing protein, partial [Planctomycetia bacterium]
LVDLPIAVEIAERAGERPESALVRRRIEATRVDAGKFRIVLTSGDPDVRGFAALDPEWDLVQWHRDGSVTAAKVGTPGSARFVLLMRRLFSLSGIVVDPRGSPLPGAELSYSISSMADGAVSSEGEVTLTDQEGRFKIGPFSAEAGSGLPRGFPSSDEITVRKAQYATLVLAPRSIESRDRTHVVVRMQGGVRLFGSLLNDLREPVLGVPVVVEYPGAPLLRKGTRTDAQGQWSVGALTPGAVIVRTRAEGGRASVRREIVLDHDETSIELVAESLRLSRTPVVTQVLGLGVADLDDEMRAAYTLPSDA